jgi:DUF1680 family protein
VNPASPRDFVVYVRIPGWSNKNVVRVNGKEVEGATPGQYLAIRRRWSSNDNIELNFDMRTQLLKANPAVTEDRGRVAFQRGPLVFCMEHLDQPAKVANLAGYSVVPTGASAEQFEGALLDGVITLNHAGRLSKSATDVPLYFSASTPPPTAEPITVKLIPYYAWANREPAAMQVWIPSVEG